MNKQLGYAECDVNAILSRVCRHQIVDFHLILLLLPVMRPWMKMALQPTTRPHAQFIHTWKMYTVDLRSLRTY